MPSSALVLVCALRRRRKPVDDLDSLDTLGRLLLTHAPLVHRAAWAAAVLLHARRSRCASASRVSRTTARVGRRSCPSPPGSPVASWMDRGTPALVDRSCLSPLHSPRPRRGRIACATVSEPRLAASSCSPLDATERTPHQAPRRGHVAEGEGLAGVKHGAFRRPASGNHLARVVVSPAYSVGDLEEEHRHG